MTDGRFPYNYVASWTYSWAEEKRSPTEKMARQCKGRQRGHG